MKNFFRFMVIIGNLPNTLTNGTTADATQVMADLNFIVNQVNANAAALANTALTNVNNNFTAVQSGTAASAAANFPIASQIQNAVLDTFQSTLGTNTLTARCAVLPLTTWPTDAVFSFIPSQTNNGPANITVDSAGSSIIFSMGSTLVGGELRAGIPAFVKRDSTKLNLLNPANVRFDLASSASGGSVRILISSTPMQITIGKQPTRTVLISGSSSTYTTPAGATRINVRMVGGGGGGGGATANNGTDGNATTFDTLTAGGGLKGNASSGIGGTGGTASGGDVNIPGGSGQGGSISGAGNVALQGGEGASSALGGGGSGGFNVAGTAGATNSGGGGGGGGGAGATASGGGGGSGGYVEKLITSPSATYTYTVGAAANGGTAGGFAGGNGAAGIIIIDEYYN